MPVARIISSSFEDALKFADYLRPLFDTVEIAQPGRVSETAVDLEVNLELCTPQQAWQEIEQLSREPESEIFVAPGTLFSEDNQPAEVGMAAEPATFPQQEFDDAGQVVEAAIAQASAAVVKAAGSNGSGTHKPGANALAEPELTWLGRTRESLRQFLAVRALLREIRQMQQQERILEQQQQRQMALQFERERREREMRAVAQMRASVPAAAPFVEQKPAPVQQSLPPSEPLEQPLSDEQLRLHSEEELRLQAEEEEAIRRGQFVEEILRRRAQEQAAPASQPSEAIEAAPVPVEFQTVPAESFAAPSAEAPALRFSLRVKRDRLRPAMALAGVTSVLLTAALVGYANRRPASPVPLSVLERSNSVQQKLPFGPAVLPAPEPEQDPASAVTVAQAPEDEAPAMASPPERHSFQADFRRVRVDRHEVDYVADDVTVRHFNTQTRNGALGRHPATAVPVSASTPGVKQISDME